MAIKLTSLAAQNPWWKGDKWTKEDHDLKKIDFILHRKKVDTGGVTIIRGIRRSGKTVYAKMLIEDMIKKGVNPRKILYISCDRYTDREIKNIVNEFLIRYDEAYVFLDEITYLKDWNILLKEFAERVDMKIVATGSNPVEIKKYSERLPGRGVEGNEYYMNPLSFRQYLKNVEKINIPEFDALSPGVEDLIPYFDTTQRRFYSYILTGGFPDAIREYEKHEKISDETLEMLIRVILGTISKEGRSEEVAREIFENIMNAGTGRTDYTSIGANLNVHHNTVRDYLETMESARILYVLRAWDISRKRHSPRKQKKVVFQSTLIPIALHRYLEGGSWDDTLNFVDENMEWLVESLVASHITWSEEIPVMREKHSFGGFFYGRKECDYVLLKNGGFYGFETKYGKVEKNRYPFDTLYLSRDTLDKDTIPVSLFLAGLKKSEKSI